MSQPCDTQRDPTVPLPLCPAVQRCCGPPVCQQMAEVAGLTCLLRVIARVQEKRFDGTFVLSVHPEG